MKKIGEKKGILFDFGGTLDLNGIHWLNYFLILYEEFSIPVSRSAIKEVFYLADAELEKLPGKERLSLEEMIRCHVHLQFRFHQLREPALEERLWRTFCDQVRKNFEKSRRVLAGLHAKYSLGMVSNFYGNVRVLCEEAGFLPYLDTVVDSAEVGVRKPDPMIFMLALKDLGLTPDDAIFVGDSFSQDIKPAKQLGMSTVWLKTQHTAPFPGNWKQFVDVTIDSVEELEELFL